MPDALHAALGKRIRERRESSDLTQDKLAREIDISRTSLTNIERGRQRVLVDQLYRIAAALDVQPAELLPAAGEFSTTVPAVTSEQSIPESVHRFAERVRTSKQS